MKHDSISKDLMETSLSASPQTELFHLWNKWGKVILKSVHKKTALLCRVCSLLGAINHFHCRTRPLRVPEKAKAVVST